MRAYFEDEEFADALSAAHARGGWRATLSIWVGAGVALALLAGGGVWAYGLMTRAPEEVPIIRASATPAKERPEDPGGAQTPHQDIRSFEAAEKGSDRMGEVALAPAPPQPTDEDLAMGKFETTGAAATASAEVVPAAVVGVEEVTPGPDTGLSPSGLIREEQELISAALSQVLAEPSATEPTPPVGMGSDQAPPYSPAVRGKPENIPALLAAARQAAASADEEVQQRAATSQIQVQLGAFPDRAQVDQEWTRILQANRDILSGRALAVQQTVSGGTVYYRLRVGPVRDGHEANTVCQALKARGQDCLVAINTDRRG